MNTVEVEIIEVIGEPKRITNGETSYWQLSVVTTCWGTRGSKTFSEIDKRSLEKYKVGYKWRE